MASPKLAQRAPGAGCPSDGPAPKPPEGTNLVRIAARRTRILAGPAGVIGTAVEVMWALTHFAFYPVGALRSWEHRNTAYGIGHLAPVQRGLAVGDIEAAGTPILLLHGMADNASVFALLRRGLRARGFGHIVTMQYSPLTTDVRIQASRLGAIVETLVAETGYERIHIVGHSLGGLIARYYVTRLGGDARVHTVVSLGTPQHGTMTAALWPSSLCRQLRIGSPLMEELAEPVEECRTRFVAYWSDVDLAIVPAENAMLRHEDLSVRNVGLSGVGHMSLPILPAVVRGISSTLAHLDVHGTTIVEGVTPLPRGSGRL